MSNFKMISFTIAALALTMAGADSRAKSPVSTLPEHVSGEMVIKLRPSSELSAQSFDALRTSLQRTLGSTQILSLIPFKTDAALERIKVADDKKLPEAIAALKKNPSVQFAEPNLIYHMSLNSPATGLPNDPDMSKLWGLVNTGQPDSTGQIGTAGSDINVLPLWKKGITGSRDVVVAVIDTGIDWTHPDLQANLYTNKGEIAGDGKDNDGNGFIDDIHGWNFYDHTNNSVDDHGHGSHCSGTIGGVGNNGVGIAGINWNVSLMPIKFLSADGSGSLEGAVEAINYATLMKVNIMSNSWGGGGYSDVMKEAISKAATQGILFVAAAGNDSSNNDTTPSYPASYDLPNVISVAAIDNQDKIADFSNFGTKTVHVAAPGVKIYSSVKGGLYDTYSGTSMATPHVSGIAALLLSANPTWTYAEIKERLINTSQPISSLRRKVTAKGRVNAYNAYYNIIPPSTDPDEKLWKDRAKSIQSEHPYKDNSNVVFSVKVPHAKYIRVIFDKVDVEAGYDKVIVETVAGVKVEELTGLLTNYTTDYVEGDSLNIRLTSDSSTNGFGFSVTKIQVIE